MNARFFIAAAIITGVSGCNTKKKTITQPEPDAITIQLDTLKVLANEPPKKEVYRETNPVNSDIIHTRLEVEFDWNQSRLNGKAIIDAKQHFYPSRFLYLNARGMDIKNLAVFQLKSSEPKDKSQKKYVEYKPDQYEITGGFSYKYENDSIKIDLGRVFNAVENFRVEIDYVAKPNELAQGGSSAISGDKGLYFVNPKGANPYKMPQIWTQGETQSSSAWFPTIDSPNEKMTQEIYMTVDDKYITLSNGILADTRKNPNGTRTDHWVLDQPHAPYLAMMAVGNFRKVVDEPWNGKEISYYVEKEYEPHAKQIFGDTKEMIEFYSKRLGVDYPWPKYSQIAVREYVSGAMENTSATLHGDFAVYQTTREMIDGKKGKDIIAHELFHQWFGDLVTCESWSNLPLNESFATYGEYLWEEYKYGRDAADHHHAGSRSGYFFSDKEVNLIRFNYQHREDMFDAFSYNKGGQVLHMLRKVVGDDAFFASLKNYLETNKHKAAEIHHLRLAFEETTGLDLNWFFNQWFLSKGRPKLNVTQKYENGDVELTVEQNQDFKVAPLYRLPVDIDVYAGGTVKRTRIWITEKKETFKIKSDVQPQLVNFDAERQLLCDLEYKKTKEEYVFQYKNAPLYGDRVEVLTANASNVNDPEIFGLFKTIATKDKYAPVRQSALWKLESVKDDKLADLKSICKEIYTSDKSTRLRAEALKTLNERFGNDADVKELTEKALSENSYAINGVALEAMAKRDAKQAMEKAKAFENEFAKDLIFPIASIYGANGGDEQLAFFQNNMKYVGGFEMVTYVSSYTKAAKRFNVPASAISAATDLQYIAGEGNKFTRFGALKGIKDIAGVWEGKEKAMKANIEGLKKEGKDVASKEADLKLISETKATLLKMYEEVK